jgi:hypothetical protein
LQSEPVHQHVPQVPRRASEAIRTRNPAIRRRRATAARWRGALGASRTRTRPHLGLAPLPLGYEGVRAASGGFEPPPSHSRGGRAAGYTSSHRGPSRVAEGDAVQRAEVCVDDQDVHRFLLSCGRWLERLPRIELGSSRWQRDALPLSYNRVGCGAFGRGSNRLLPSYQDEARPFRRRYVPRAAPPRPKCARPMRREPGSRTPRFLVPDQVRSPSRSFPGLYAIHCGVSNIRCRRPRSGLSTGGRSEPAPCGLEAVALPG